jgi:hypothetical protein
MSDEDGAGGKMMRRRSSRLNSAPYLMKRASSTGLSGPLASLTTEEPEQPKRRSSVVDAASARKKFEKLNAEAAKPQRSGKCVTPPSSPPHRAPNEGCLPL